MSLTSSGGEWGRTLSFAGHDGLSQVWTGHRPARLYRFSRREPLTF